MGGLIDPMGALTIGEVRAGLAILRAFPVADAEKALSARLENLPDDARLAADIASVLAEAGAPGAAQAALAIKVMAWIAANGGQAEAGALTGIASGARGGDPWMAGR